jgi:hypothetical protein
MNRRQLLSTLLAAPLLGKVAEAAGPYTALNVRFCLAKDDTMSVVEHRSLMAQLGINSATLYYKLNAEDNRAHPYDWIRFNYLDNSHEVVLVLIIDAATRATTAIGEESAVALGNLQQVIDGKFDAALEALVAAIAQDARPIKVRLFHEFDGFWFPWGIQAQGNTPELFVRALAHVVGLFNAARAPVTFEVNVNRENGQGEVLGAAASIIPLIEPLVHYIAVSTYNRGCTSKEHPYDRSFQYEFRPVYTRLTELTRLPITIAEVSTAGACSARLPWFQAMLDLIDKDFHRVREVTFFFGEGEATDGGTIEWALDPADYDAFRVLLECYRQKWQQPPK